jgi:hypothetical protein
VAACLGANWSRQERLLFGLSFSAFRSALHAKGSQVQSNFMRSSNLIIVDNALYGHCAAEAAAT